MSKAKAKVVWSFGPIQKRREKYDPSDWWHRNYGPMDYITVGGIEAVDLVIRTGKIALILLVLLALLVLLISWTKVVALIVLGALALFTLGWASFQIQVTRKEKKA